MEITATVKFEEVVGNWHCHATVDGVEHYGDGWWIEDAFRRAIRDSVTGQLKAVNQR